MIAAEPRAPAHTACFRCHLLCAAASSLVVAAAFFVSHASPRGGQYASDDDGVPSDATRPTVAAVFRSIKLCTEVEPIV